MYTNKNTVYFQRRMPVGHVRVIHTVPDAPNVDVYANDEMVVDNLAFGDYTDYLTVPEGTYEIALYVAGTKDSPVLADTLTISDNSILTVAAVGNLSDIEFLAITDVDEDKIPERSMVRFLHLSPNAPAVDITLPDGTVIFSNISFEQITSYMDVMPMDYTLQVRVAGTDTVVLTVPGVNLEEEKFYTVYAIGLAGEDPELQALLIEDGDYINR